MMKLTDAQMSERLEKAPRKKAGRIGFECPNCNKHFMRTIWAHAHEIDEDGKLYYDFYEATAVCSCGAKILVADNYEGFDIYWLNKKEMGK